MAKLETFPLQVGVLFPHYPASQYRSLWEGSTKCKRKKEGEEMDSWRLPVLKFVFKGIVFLT